MNLTGIKFPLYHNDLCNPFSFSPITSDKDQDQMTNRFRITEKETKYFKLQRRKGHGKSKSLASILIGTMDSVFDTRPPPYRILHQTPNSEVFYSKCMQWSRV